MTRTLAISLLTLGDPETLTGGYLYHRRMAEAAARHGARLSFLSFPRHPLPRAAARAPRLLASAAGSDVVVLDSIVAAHLGAWPAPLARAPAPLAAIVHQPPGGIDGGRLAWTVRAILDRRAYRRAALVIAASDALAEHLLAAGVPAELLRVVPPGCDVLAAGEPPGRAPGGLGDGPGIALLCVGNWVARKGILELLEAVGRLPAGAATLHLVGRADVDRRYAACVRRRAARPDLAGRVVVHGPLGRAQVAACYAAADAFVLAATTEPYGTVYGEAMTAGLPVVGWRAGNLVHLARDGREGFLVEPGDVNALAARLGLLSDDSALRRRMGAAARERAGHLPIWADSAAAFFAALAELTAASPRRA